LALYDFVPEGWSDVRNYSGGDAARKIKQP
jgi:hypothetical protein